MRAMQWAFIAGLFLIGNVTRADDQAAARKAFKEGVAQFNAGRSEAAAKSFRRADELSPSWRIQYNIGQCEAALKRYGSAIEAFEAYLAQGGDEITAERQDEVLKELERLRQKVGGVDIRGSDGVDVIIDGVKRGTTPLAVALRVTAGIEHELTLARGNAVVLVRKFKVGGGQTMVVEVPKDEVVGPAPPAPAHQPEGEPSGEEGEADENDVTLDSDQTALEADDGPSWMLVTGITAAGAGVAMMAIGGGFYAKGQKDIDDYKKAADQGNEDRYYNLKDDVLPADQAMITTGFVVGGILLATGAALLILEFTGDEEDSLAAELTVALDPSAGGVALTF